MEDPIVKMIDYLSMVKVSKMFIGNIDYIPLYFKNRLFLLFKSNESKLCIYKSFYFSFTEYWKRIKGESTSDFGIQFVLEPFLHISYQFMKILKQMKGIKFATVSILNIS